MSEIKVGDWVEVVEVDRIDKEKGIEVGDVYKVACTELVGRKDAVVVNRNYENSDILHLNQIKKVDAPAVENSEIKIGDWIEVVEPTERHNRMGIKVGNRYEVSSLSVSGVFIKQEGLSYTVYIHYSRIKKVEPPIEPPKLKDVPKAIESAVSKFEMLARSYTENLTETLVAKNADYGNSFEKSYEKHGLVSTVIRLEDKLNRLESLIENEAKVNESIDDTLLDIAGYAILTLIARSGNRDNNQ